MENIKIAIIDIIGLTYDGSTLIKRGLGGSESSVILMAKELAKIGFHVTVINNCIDAATYPGVFNEVTYIDHKQLPDIESDLLKFDVVISSRTVIPFLPEYFYDQFQEFNPSIYSDIKKNAKLKIVWMHDTFCRGDHLLEEMINFGDIDEVFTLSDFHTSYITNCDHGSRRMFEILKKHIFLTRNGVVKYYDEVNIENKDPYLFVYNASVTKGMIPLVNNIWETIKYYIPKAKLKVIGGYYRFRENADPDEQEKIWFEMAENPKFNDLDIEFTGIISQIEIADILVKASYMLYPGAFPETFGISSLESLCYNTPIITTRFGALEEVAIENSCYLIDYPIVPNNLFPNIDSSKQISKFIEMILSVFNNKYLHQQKMYNCNIVKDICTWDTVALQWKQHLYKKLNEFLPYEDYINVKNINQKVHKIFGRRFSNEEEWPEMKNEEQRIIIISPFFNAENYIERCINSVASQDYQNYIHVLIDDNSTDNSSSRIFNITNKLSPNRSDKIDYMRNTENNGAISNQIHNITKRTWEDDDIIILLDGDDWLNNRNDIFDIYNNLFNNGVDFCYGSSWSLADNIPLISQPYSSEVIKNKSFRSHKFNWGIPYPHLRVFRKSLMNEIDEDKFKDENGKFYRAGGDVAVFYNLIEQANKIHVLQDIVHVYNDKNPINDYKINGDEQTMNANKITTSNNITTDKKILIAIPTNKYIEPETFKSIYDLIIPEGFTTQFQYFYGYSRTQIYNLIGNWAKNFDYTIFARPNKIMPKNFIKKISCSSSDIMFSAEFLILCTNKKMFTDILQYPQFEPKNTLLEEIEYFISKATAKGAIVE